MKEFHKWKEPIKGKLGFIPINGITPEHKERVEKSKMLKENIEKRLAELPEGAINQENRALFYEVLNSLFTEKATQSENEITLTAPAFLEIIQALLENNETQLLRALCTEAAIKPAVPKLPRSPNPFQDDKGETAKGADNQFTHFAGEALAAGGKDFRRKVRKWQESKTTGQLQYRKERGSWLGGSMTAYFEPGNYNAKELQAKVESLDALHLDVFLATLTLICDPRNNATSPQFGWFTINPAQIAGMKAFRRHGHDRRVLIGKIVEAVHTLSEFRTDIVNLPYSRNDPKVRITERGCRLFHIGSTVYIEQGELFEHPNDFPEHRQPDAINAFAGKWANHWLQNGGRYFWTAKVTRALLELGNSKAEDLARKIGILLLTIEGKPEQANSHNAAVTLTISDLLQAIGELLVEEFRGQRNGESRQGQDWARRMEQALFGYEDDNDMYHPGAFEILQGCKALATVEKGPDYPIEKARGRGWVERWLSAHITLITPEAAAKLERVIEPPPARLPPRLEKKRRNRGTGKPRRNLEPGQFLDAATVAAIYAAYRARNWNQGTMAKELKVARPTLSNVLNRREAPSCDLAARIRAFLDSPMEGDHE